MMSRLPPDLQRDPRQVRRSGGPQGMREASPRRGPRLLPRPDRRHARSPGALPADRRRHGLRADVYDRIEPLPETTAVIEFCRRLSHEIPWSAALCTTALFEAEVIELSRTVGSGLAEHYGCRPDWGGLNYIVHVEVEQEESEDTEKAILQHIRTDADRRAAEAAMRTLHGLLEAYADVLTRTYVR